MSITIFGVIWITVLVYCFFQKDSVYMLTITLLSMVFQASSVIVIGESGIGPQLITSIVMIVYSLFQFSFENKKMHLIFKKARKHNSLYIIMCKMFSLVFIFTIVLSFKKNCCNIYGRYIYRQEKISFILLCMQIIIYILCFISIYKIKINFSYYKLEKIIDFIISFVIIVGLFQFVGTTILPENPVYSLFYTKDTSSAYYWYDFYPRFFCTFMEPSYCSAFLVGAFYFEVSKDKMSKVSILRTLVILFEIVLTFSSTAYGTLFIGGCIYLFICKRRRVLKYLLPLAFISVIILAASGYLRILLDDVIFKKMESGSGQVRNLWNEHAWKYFTDSRYIGIGYKNARGSSLFFSSLAQVGIIGSFAWIMNWLLPVIYVFKIKNNFSKSISLFSACVLIAMLISIPDLDFVTLWQSMYINALVINIHEKEKHAPNISELNVSKKIISRGSRI